MSLRATDPKLHPRRTAHRRQSQRHAPIHSTIARKSPGSEAQTANRRKEPKTPPQIRLKNAETAMLKSKAQARVPLKSP